LVGGQLMTPVMGQGQQTPTFRATAELVTVDVFVRSGTQVVPGLAADEFLVLDNAVRQRVERVDAARVPLDVSLVVDVSGGSPNWWGTPRPGEEVAGRLEEIVRRAQRALRTGDRVRLVTIDTYAEEVLPFQPADASRAIGPRVASGGMSSLHDALIAALLEPVEPDRRHLIIAMTKADDTISTGETTAVQEVARRSAAVLHIVLGTSLVGDTACETATPEAAPGITRAKGQVDADVREDGSRIGVPELMPVEAAPTVETCKYPRRRFWQPANRQVESQLPALAEATGGAYYGFDAFGLYPDFADEVDRIFNQFRQGYVLRYTPQGVRRQGWHDIVVSVPAHPDYTVQARRGYLVEAPSGSARSTPAAGSGRPAPAGTPSAERLRETFASGNYRAFELALAGAPGFDAIVRDVRTSPTPWAGTPKRDAVFALEMAVAGLNRPDNGTREEAMRLLEQYLTLVRQPLGADTFECAWYWTGIAALQGVIRPAAARPFIQRALARCPGESRFHLAAAVVTDQQWPVGTVRPLTGALSQIGPSPTQRQDVVALYDAAMRFPETAIEARMRGAWFAYRVGEFDRALDLIAAASGPVADPQLAYLRDLVHGQILRALGRDEEAAAAFRRALATWPRAQSARLGLIALELVRGNRDEAARLAAAVEAAPEGDFDPWWRYWQGDFRAFTGILARLRELAR
jgi:VWFA-related protein